ncbi:MAG: Spy/CpxP family protein refolding chaperone [Myxococcales bacterium]|nr:Spy/CpxP family protein refolding chaperone [Myxococcales bacterium]
MTRKIWIGAMVITLALAGGATALLANPTVRAAGWFGHSGGFGHGGPGRHGFGGHHRGKHLRFGIEWVLDEVDATDEQVEQIVAIAEAATEDLHGLRDQHEAHREALVAAIGGDEIDRDALEELRAEGIELADGASQRLVTAIADAAAILTPEQRKALIEEHARHHRRGWRH